MDDPLRGLNKRQRRAYERRAARYFQTYDPAQHQGWFAEALRAGDHRVTIASRVDLDHPRQPGNSETHGCMDCSADLQLPADVPSCDVVPKLCLACAYRRATTDS